MISTSHDPWGNFTCRKNCNGQTIAHAVQTQNFNFTVWFNVTAGHMKSTYTLKLRPYVEKGAPALSTRTFMTHDTNGNGIIEAHELKAAIGGMGSMMTDAEIAKFMAYFDTSKDTQISLAEFDNVMLDLMTKFLASDQDSDGFVDATVTLALI